MTQRARMLILPSNRPNTASLPCSKTHAKAHTHDTGKLQQRNSHGELYHSLSNMKALTRGFERNGWRGVEGETETHCMWSVAIPECPCMYFGSNIIVSCLHADAAWMKMDVYVFVCPCWGSVSTDGCKTVAFPRTQRHLEETFQGEDSHMNRAWQSEKLMAVCSPLTSWQSNDKRPSFKMWGAGQTMREIRYGVSCLVRPKNIIYKWICRGLVDSRKRTPTCMNVWSITYTRFTRKRLRRNGRGSKNVHKQRQTTNKRLSQT